ncbi:MAG: hypothetical protein A3D31_11445 [Candidatus Fluviicola riflensis]|nr:MAG: hypothetical protein CHH17_15875 [Candidatus Fluviicola riflensis]OGS77604.1 MAG: hypothetical protein A3D31_11445 [Candidatus Fluviicola riflensis]OGS84187.1 MAG: hypothetical protein A3E30_12855 [Fluviicola sp. RIFCSPHIGHO2_12_FULL_43_24]OGS84670.1 MAG: hypothetical protein A2724_08380 [Fluviicola sp. RIFCSPHIGHO2_01_FULL_43_53]
MNNRFGKSYRERHIYYTGKVTNYARRYYIYAYNLYGWYWLYKIIVDPKLQCDWENYLIWLFAMLAQLFFEVDVRNANKDVDVESYYDHYFPPKK